MYSFWAFDKLLPFEKRPLKREKTTVPRLKTQKMELGKARLNSNAGRSSRFWDLGPDKMRGGYYTSEEVATWISAWAIRKKTDKVLEPSCGDGSFLVAVAKRFKTLGLRSSKITQNLVGVEINTTEANRSRAHLRDSLGNKASDVVRTGDFFSWWQQPGRPSFDVVIGNPPFIRYQTFPEPYRTSAMNIMSDLGLRPNRLTNIWVPFVASSISCLRPGGRLALVLPAELLQVSYAAQLRSYLTQHFSRIDIVTCNELFFENAEQEVVLLLADGVIGNSPVKTKCRVTLTEALTVQEITKTTPAEVLKRSQPKIIDHGTEKWLKYFLSEQEILFMRELKNSSIATALSNHASVDVGVVTGKNEFFVLNNEQIKKFKLLKYTTPLVSRAVQLKGARISKSEWNELSSSGDRVHLLNLSEIKASKLSNSLLKYLKAGERNEFHKGFKCSIREPWYAVPSVWIPHAFLFRQIYDFPRVVLNKAGATSTDTIHRFTCKKDNPERVIANTYSWLTAASAEIEGRSYGGGVLELEPSEAERLLMPAKLNGAMPLAECDRLTRAGKLDVVLEHNARIVLMGHMGLSKSDCYLLKNIWEKMRNRRLARKRSIPKLDMQSTN